MSGLKNQLANLLTKALTGPTFQEMRYQIGVQAYTAGDAVYIVSNLMFSFLI